jgi:hypothetical protein
VFNPLIIHGQPFCPLQSLLTFRLRVRFEAPRLVFASEAAVGTRLCVVVFQQDSPIQNDSSQCLIVKVVQQIASLVGAAVIDDQKFACLESSGCMIEFVS